jgi:ABC-type multidrug transport system fused ATPase/permease subunit
MKIKMRIGIMPDFLVNLWKHLSRRRQRQFVLLLALMLLAAMAEVVSMGAVLPFLSVITAPENAFNQPFVADIAGALGIVSADQLVLPLTLFFVTAALFAGGVRILLLGVSTRLSYATGADLSIEAYRRTLYQPYRVHVARSSSEVISGIVTKMASATAVMNLMLLLLSSAVLVVAIISVLIAINPLVAFLAAIGFGASYSIISWLTRYRLKRNSQRISEGTTEALRALQEGLGGIRDVLLDGAQPIYCDIYSKAERPLRSAQGNNIFIGGSPRFAMEALGMALIAALAFGLSREEAGITAALPALGALALGAQRLLPALQSIYSSLSGIIGHKDSLIAVLDLLDQPLPDVDVKGAFEALDFKQDIRLNSVYFRYGDEEGPWLLEDFSLTIPKGARVGFVGTTASGKSTMLDLIMGLLAPNQGQILVDGKPIIGKLLRHWQQSIAHVPQNIYLADITIAENIAFGVQKDAVDLERVKRVAHQAQIAEFIEESPMGYQTRVGEQGVRLSGGQRQRIGIARALYKQAGVLVFDEATSALDNTTEQAVMQAIEGLSNDLTILMIAHRITTVQGCDIIIELDRGRLVGQGSYSQLLRSSESFRQMAKGVYEESV